MDKPLPDEPNTIRLKSGRVVNVLTTEDTAESRKQFASLNTHKTRGVARVSKRRNQRNTVEGGADTDIVDISSGGPTHEVISDGGGRRMNGAIVYVVFWGNKWLSQPRPSPSIDDLLGDIISIMSGPYLSATVQYDVSPIPNVGYATLAGAWVEHRAPPSYEFTMVDVNYEAWLLMTSGPIPAANDTVVCIFMPPRSDPA
jgi:hypothetical protein